MPVYEYECQCGQKIERVCKISEHTRSVDCVCGKEAKQILSNGVALRDSDLPWLTDAVKTLQPSYERPVQTRSEWKKYMKDHHLACIG